VTGVDIDELGPNVLAAQMAVTSPVGTRSVTAPLGTALALAAALDVPVRVAGALMDRLAVPVTPDDPLGPFESGRSRNEATGVHWDDYAVTVADGEATLSAAVPDITAKPEDPPPPGPEPVRVDRDTRLLTRAITGTRDWTRYEIASQVPADAEHLGFELSLTGPGMVRLRHVELIRADGLRPR
jgi:hypothetical protein